MWYREANLTKLSEYWSDKKLKDELFEIIAKSYKRKNANGDEERLKEIEKEPPGENINIFKKVGINNEIHTLLFQVYDKVLSNLHVAEEYTHELLDKFCEKYFISSSDRDRIYQIIQQWLIEYREYVKSLRI
jgi:hypothetical protein